MKILLHFSHSLILATALLLQACGGAAKTTQPTEDVKLAAIKVLREAIRPANATISSSAEIDWSAGVLPWDRYSLPVFSPNGLHAAVQLGKAPSLQVLSGNSNEIVESTTIEMHILDPIEGREFSPFHIEKSGLILTRSANDNYFLVESPVAEQGRWIGKIDWATGNVHWIASDELINAFPTINAIGDIAWSRREQTDDRFHLVVKTARGQRVIDDGESDWLLPMFLGVDRLRVYRIRNGGLALVEFDLTARDPLLTALTLPILESGATREMVLQIATTNPVAPWHTAQAFYHPLKQRMVVWQPGNAIETASLLWKSVAATPVDDGSWLVATDDRIIRQKLGADDGVHIRNRLAIPIATTSNQWTHYLLIPQGNRIEVRAINLSR